MDRKRYDQEMYDKMYDMIELIYILNRLSNNSYVDDRSKDYLIGMLNDVESIKSNFDKYRVNDSYMKNQEVGINKYNGYYSNKNDSFIDKIIFYLKSLNDWYSSNT